MALAAPTLIPASALGAGGKASPSERVTLGVVGWGMQGPGNTDAFLHLPDCQVVAACDLDKGHLQSALEKINGHYNNKDCKPYEDYRAMMARKDIDAVMIAIPDTWHALAATEAARNKKDIYGEKPLARTIAEQQAIVKAVRTHGRIWQTGSWQRSQRPFRVAAEIVRNGLIGKLTRVEVGLPSGHYDFAGTGKPLLAKLAKIPGAPNDLSKVLPGTPAWEAAVSPPPVDLNYNVWTGPSKMEPYIQARTHMNWRWNYNVGGGQLLDWIGHHCDIAHWGMDMDSTGGPSEIEGEGEFPDPKALWNTCTRYRINLKYPRISQWLSPAGTTTSKAAPSGLALKDGSGWTEAGSMPPTWIGSRNYPTAPPFGSTSRTTIRAISSSASNPASRPSRRPRPPTIPPSPAISA